MSFEAAAATPQAVPARKWHKLRRVATICLVVVAGVVTWYAGVVVSARAYTRDTVLPKVREARFPLALADLSPRQRDILLKVEDPNFYGHHGLDLHTPGAGITTITQALVKYLYFSNFEPGLAKIRQSVIARFALDPLMPKDEQLTLFINTAYFGRGARGFQEAARLNFKKPFRELNEDEYITLVAMLIAPEVFDPLNHPDWSAERVARIKLLADGHYQPRGLFDLYYGKIDPRAQKELPPLSYFGSTYD